MGRVENSFDRQGCMTETQSWEADAARLLGEIGVEGGFQLKRLPEGGNNQSYRLETEAGPFFLKRYFHHPDDKRERLKAEFSFCRFAWSVGADMAPKALAKNDKQHIGLYEYIDGRPATANDAGPALVEHAIEFYQRVNRRRGADAELLPNGSEACFSIREHLDLVSRRVERAMTILPHNDIHERALDFARGRLASFWQELKNTAMKRLEASGKSNDEPLDQAERRVSPSDFGFHNALIDADGRVRFIDFEYAGWDDPARTVCDFFCQPRIPAPMSCFEVFANRVAADAADSDRMRARIDALWPVYQVKWCCIMLNQFLPVGEERRRFADNRLVSDEQKASQLERALSRFDLIAI